MLTFLLSTYWQGLTFPVAEFFLEDVLEKTHYNIKSEFDNFQGKSRRTRTESESEKDPLTAVFEVWLNSPSDEISKYYSPLMKQIMQGVFVYHQSVNLDFYDSS